MRNRWLDGVAGPDGEFWARLDCGEEGAPPRWTVFDAEGVALGEVETPPGVTVLQVEEDWILGQETDGLGVVRIVLHTLRRDAASRP